MLTNTVGGMPGLELLLQELLSLQFLGREQTDEEAQWIVRGVPWLNEPLGESKADHDGPPPETDGWTCPRCRSHRCVLVDPGNLEDATYRCAVCGYTFHPSAAARLPVPAE